ncbi:hypothetical protein EG68_01193 [Paragonimus skrjabini miyazakii]|uniref:EF-hand domain-containing protein n=1 Tax=Paragonimus skrjabini miyazakii TaxID=59628 RepID=A0A8S9Z288_9TREM|nr:hypothetical protein EG68_01193 [Paragonimus skrjabini miyazakii]
MLTAHEKKRLLSIFEQLDTDKNGSISRTEMEKRITEMNIDKSYIKTAFARLDLNRDGIITREEYKTVFGIHEDPVTNEEDVWTNEWIQLFQEIDVDNSGRLSVDEVHAIFAGDEFTEPVDVVKSWIAQFDEDKDGQLNEAEFLEFVRQKVSKKK